MRIFLFFLVLLVLGCRQEKRYHDELPEAIRQRTNATISGIMKFQKGLNAEFKNPETSPLPDKYRKHFNGLDFFEPDTNYIIKARFERTPNARPFLMPTTTDRKTKEVLYGIAHFELHDARHRLEVYQSLELLDQEGYELNLFLPFLDDTNGNETYGGGRYIDIEIPHGEVLTIDFNKAYNPYCAYNKKYSCPLVPRQNYLRTSVRAGVKAFNKE